MTYSNIVYSVLCFLSLRVIQYTLILCSEREHRPELGREEAGVLLGHLLLGALDAPLDREHRLDDEVDQAVGQAEVVRGFTFERSAPI